jgi:hypothetical protein
LEHVEAAQELLGMTPPPSDIRARIDALYRMASAEEKPLFAGLYEALVVLENA